MKRYPSETLDDAADRRHDEHVQSLLDIERDGYDAGRLGLGFGLSSDLTVEEQNRFRIGFERGQQERVARKVA